MSVQQDIDNSKKSFVVDAWLSFRALVATASISLLIGTGVSLFLPSQTQAQDFSAPQQRQNTFENSKKRIRVDRVKPQDLNALGYEVMDNVLIVPELRIEGGYDSNHDELFVEDGSGFALIDGSLMIGYVKENQALTLTFKSSYDPLFGLSREDRWDAGVTLDSYYRLNENWEYSGGAFYLRDEVSFSRNEIYSSYSQFDYTSEMLVGYLKTESYDIRYLNGPNNDTSLTTLLRQLAADSTFDRQRHEVAGGVIYGPDRLVGVYSNAGVGFVNYNNQPFPSVIDRDASEYWVSAGLRFNLSAHLRAEVGWRYNERDIKDNFIGNYNSDGFDAKIVWVPNALFSLTYEVDTKLDEPSAITSVVADVRKHTITGEITTSTRTSVQIYASNEYRREIGSTLKYEENQIGASFAYDVTAVSQFYISAFYENTEEVTSASDFDRYRIGVGYRIKFVQSPGEAPENVNLVENILPNFNLIETRVGYSKLYLPESSMIAVTNQAYTQSLYNQETNDGELDGARIDVRVPGFAGIITNPELSRLGLGNQQIAFNLAGYYGHYENKQNSTCNSFVLTHNCVFFNIFDPQPFIENNTGPNGDFAISTKRRVDTWGLALEAEFFGPAGEEVVSNGVLPQFRTHPFRVGLAIKGLQQRTDLFAYDTSIPDPVDIREDLDTFYYGAYLGIDRTFDLGRGFNLLVNAEAGVYYADANYKSRYLAFIDVGGGTYVLDRGELELTDDDISFIGSVRVELNKQISRGVLGLYAEGEYYSYVPEMRYNNEDVSTAGLFSIFDITGNNPGTSIDEGEAFSFSLGARYTVPLN